MERIGKDKTLGILVVDGRQTYMGKLLSEKGYQVRMWSEGDEGVGDAHVVILPVPVSRVKDQKWLIESLRQHKDTIELCLGGVFGEELVKALREVEIPWSDVLRDPEVAVRNAIATAEGTVAELSKLMPVNIEGSNVIVMGFGKCGKPIAEKLYCMGANVSVVARSERALSLAHYFGFMDYPMDAEIPFAEADAVVNTIPALVVNEREIDLLQPDAVVLDIASAPGGCNFPYLKKKGIAHKLALGLPGIYSPKTSAEILLEAMPFGYKPSKTKWKS